MWDMNRVVNVRALMHIEGEGCGPSQPAIQGRYNQLLFEASRDWEHIIHRGRYRS